jgi:hypothetical protein
MQFHRSSLLVFFFVVLLVVVLLVVLPLTVFFSRQEQQTQQQAASLQTQPLGPSGSWNLVWHDEFDDATGMSGSHNGLQASKWNSGWWSGPSSPGVGDTHAVTNPINGISNYFGPASILFPGDNAVHLHLQQGVDNGGNYNGHNIEWGMISTAGLLAFNPANAPVPSSLAPYVVNGPSVLEVRARFPGPNGVAGDYWPGIWLTNAGNYGGTNPSGAAWPGGQTYNEEIDLHESGQGSLGSSYVFHFHAASEYGGMSSNPSSMQNTDMSLAYHTYTYYFTSTFIQLWVDGIPVTGITPSTSQISAQWKYPQYLMFSPQAKSGATYPTSLTGQPNDMMINYVRVWQQCTTNCTQLSSTPTSANMPTSSSGKTSVSLTLCPHGLGNCGDNANPSSGGNTNPLHTSGSGTLSIFDTGNNQIAVQTGQVSYIYSSQNFLRNNSRLVVLMMSAPLVLHQRPVLCHFLPLARRWFGVLSWLAR